MERIAILGGGLGSLAAAFEITSAPDWRDRFEVTLYQMGWRLGGKCATGRGPNGRIQEHGIHGFLGSYHNALSIVRRCYAELDRPDDHPLSSFDKAFVPQAAILFWEFLDGRPEPWTIVYPDVDEKPEVALAMRELVFSTSSNLINHNAKRLLLDHAHLEEAQALHRLLEVWAAIVAAEHNGRHNLIIDALTDVCTHLRDWAQASGITPVRRLFTLVDWIRALIEGAVAEQVWERGYQHLDRENFLDFLKRYGASDATLNSPLSTNVASITYNYPHGDTTLTPQMSAASYLHWCLMAFGYTGACGYLFRAGTGESVIQPMYELLKRRGVKFEFFHKVERLGLDDAGQAVADIEFAVQAELKPGLDRYAPLKTIKGIECWPAEPDFDQLVQGEALRAGAIDLESYWAPWTPVRRKSLRVGRDFDKVVLGISIGALPHVAPDLIAARPDWRAMVEHVPGLITQAAQIWLSKSSAEMGALTMPEGAGTTISGSYVGSPDGMVDLTDLIAWEDWPADKTPQALWYFCGLMAEYDPEPPFSDHDYPKRQVDRVRHQMIQYLQATTGRILPNASPSATTPGGDPFGLDFELLVDTDAPPARGVNRLRSQFLRANIDPSERYVGSPPGSGGYRLDPIQTGFSNLTIAGDWVWNGLNVGSAEGAFMGGRLAAHAVSSFPALDDVIGYRPKDAQRT